MNKKVVLSRYIIKKIVNALRFSRGNNAIHEGRFGRYIMSSDYNVHFYPYDGSARIFLGSL